MGDIADAGSFMDFLKAIGNSIAHPQKKSQSRTKSTKQPASKQPASPKPTFARVPGRPMDITCPQHRPLQKQKAQKPIFHTPFPFLENAGSSSARSRPTQGISTRQFPPGTDVKDPFTGKVFGRPDCYRIGTDAEALTPRTRITDSSSTNAVSFSSACTTKRFPSLRCASAIQIVHPLELIAEKCESKEALPSVVDCYFITG